MAGRVGVLGCCCCGWLVALILAPIGQAAPTGKLAPERRDKNEWRQAINDWQANENQEFMREYEEQQSERERIRQRNAPKFDPTNPKEYLKSIEDSSAMMGVGGMGGGSPDGAQITFVRLKNGAMKNVAETEKLVARWRDLLSTIGLAAFPHVLERDQLLLNTQEGWRVPDMKEFALDQPEVKYFEHNSKKFYAEGVDPNEPDAPGRSDEEVDKERAAPRLAAEEQEQKRREKRLQKAKEKAAAKQKLRTQLGLEDEPESDSDDEKPDSESAHEDEPHRHEPVIHGGWSPDWSDCKLCKRACHSTASIDRIRADELTREVFVKQYVGRKPLLITTAPTPPATDDAADQAAELGRDGLGKARWSRAQMLKQWGDHLVQLGTPSTLSEGSAAPGHGMRFSEYVRLMDWYDDALEKGVSLHDSADGSGKPVGMWGLHEWHPPVALGIDDALITEDNLSLSLDWAGGGAPFQISRGEIFHELIWGGGGVRWHLYRGDETPANGYNLHAPHTEWVKRSYKKKGTWNGKSGSVAPLSCMQQEGDILYVPAGWYMGTVSCGQTLTISAKLPSAPVFDPATPWDPTLEGYESYVVPFTEGIAAVKAGAHDTALPLLRLAAEKTNERNDVVMYYLGRVLGHIDGTNGRRPVEAIEQLNKCVELNPLNVKCWLYICVSKVQSQDMRGAATVFDRAWSLIPMALHDDEHNDEMMLVHKLRGIFQNAGPPPPRSPPHGDEL